MRYRWKTGTRLRAGAWAFGLLLVLVAPPSGAASFYLGASAGQAITSVSDAQLTQRLADTGLSGTGRATDTERTGWKVYGGYHFTQSLSFLAVEGGYTRLGEITLAFDGFSPTSARQLAEIAPITGDLWELSLVARYPISETWHLLTRLGAARWEMDYALGNDKGSLSGTDPVLGLAVERQLAGHWFMRLGWDHYAVPREDTDLFTFGLLYRFGEPAQRPASLPAARTTAR